MLENQALNPAEAQPCRASQESPSGGEPSWREQAGVSPAGPAPRDRGKQPGPGKKGFAFWKLRAVPDG